LNKVPEYASPVASENLCFPLQRSFCVPSECDRPDPWRFGFAVVHKGDDVMMGMCGFVGPPNSDSVVEIGCGIAPAYKGKGYATEAARPCWISQRATTA
jgi:RimJ/RimL family protein N-acetyltransferase